MSPATIELTAPGISCQKCKTNIESDLAREPGVEHVTVDVGARHIRITYDHEQTRQPDHRATFTRLRWRSAGCCRAPTG